MRFGLGRPPLVVRVAGETDLVGGYRVVSWWTPRFHSTSRIRRFRLTPKHLDDTARKPVVDLSMARNWLGDARIGIAIPIVLRPVPD